MQALPISNRKLITNLPVSYQLRNQFSKTYWPSAFGKNTPCMGWLSFDLTGINGAITDCNNQFIITRDGGFNWHQINSDLISKCQISGLAVISDGRIVILTDNSSLNIFDKNNHWQSNYVYSCMIEKISRDGELLIGSDFLKLSLFQNSKFIIPQFEGKPFQIEDAAKSGKNIFILSKNGLIGHSINYGQSWSFHSLHPFSPAKFYHCRAFANNQVIVGGKNSLLYLYNGKKWRKLDVPFKNITFFDFFLSADGNHIFAAGCKPSLSGLLPVILYCQKNKQWQAEKVNKDYEVVTDLAWGKAGLFASPDLSPLLIRKESFL